MDYYFERYLLEAYPELADWANAPMDVRLEVYELIGDRGRGYIQLHLMNRPEEAKRIWSQRACEEVTHHACPHCEKAPSALGGGLELVCLNLKCPYVLDSWEPENAHPWVGYNHVAPSDANCGPERWDIWDN